MKEVRCPNCSHLLMRSEDNSTGKLEVKCNSCKKIVVVRYEQNDVIASVKVLLKD